MPVQIAVAVVEDRGRYLVGHRSGDAPLAGYWEFPGGKLIAGESPADAAARECREETGLEVDVHRRYVAVEHHYEHGVLRLHFFACRPRDADVAPRGSFRWVPAAELDEYAFPPANAAVLELLKNRG